MSNAIAAIGTLLQIGDGSLPIENFTTIAEVKDISGPEFSLDLEDVTNQDTPNYWEEQLPTILRSGQLTFDINFIPTEVTHDPHTGLLADFLARTKRNFQLVFPDTLHTTWSFSAYVVQVSMNAPVTGVLGANVALKIVGEPTLAPAS